MARSASDIPVALTPEGGWSEFPPPALAGCEEPLAVSAPSVVTATVRQTTT